MSVPRRNSAGYSVMLSISVHVYTWAGMRQSVAISCYAYRIAVGRAVLTLSRILTVRHQVLTLVGKSALLFWSVRSLLRNTDPESSPWLCFHRLCFLALLPRGSASWLCFQSLFAVALHPRESCMICTIVLPCHVTRVLTSQEGMMTSAFADVSKLSRPK